MSFEFNIEFFGFGVVFVNVVCKYYSIININFLICLINNFWRFIYFVLFVWYKYEFNKYLKINKG